MRTVVFFLVTTAVFAQSRGGFAGGFSGGASAGFRGQLGGPLHSSAPGTSWGGAGWGHSHQPVISSSPFFFTNPNSAYPGWIGIPPVSPIPPLGGNAGFYFGNPNFSNRYSGNRYGFGNGIADGIWPYYYPFLSLDDGYDYMGQESPPVNNVFVTELSRPPSTQPAPPPPPKAANPVVHEYTWTAEVNAAEEVAFTIALKDGSRRSAVITWVQDRQLRYVDSEGRKQALSSDLIDHDATRRLNQEKKLQMQLPPV